jgi:hypothetical protein
VLLNIDVDYQINPNADTLQSISINKMIYFDGFMRVKFLDRVLLLKRAFGLLDLPIVTICGLGHYLTKYHGSCIALYSSYLTNSL